MVKLISLLCRNIDVACYGRINSLFLLIEVTWRQCSFVISVAGFGDPEHPPVMCFYMTLMARDINSRSYGGGCYELSLSMTERALIGKTHTWTHTHSLETVQGLLRKRERFDDSIKGHGYKTLLDWICTRGILSGTSLVYGPCAHNSLRGVA